MGINANIKNALLTTGNLYTIPDNAPPQYAGRQKRYLDTETGMYVYDYLKYASDYFEADAQGLDINDPKKWVKVHIRMADIVKPSATLTHKFDESKLIMIAERGYDYVRSGTKFVTMGNTWLSTNPANMSASNGQGIVDRCNASWNSLDYYGNIHTEPIVVKKLLMSANDSDYQMGVLVTKGYFTLICQYNEWTRQLDTNSRIILGSAAYRITGYSDFNMEFTGDYDSVRLLEFNARYEEPNFDIDDMENYVAGGLTFSWEVSANFKDTLKVGETDSIIVISRRNDVVVTGNDENEISYTYESSDESVATVDENGTITAVGEGQAIITIKLAQNPLYGATATLQVVSASTTPHTEFTSPVPTTLKVMESAVISAAYFDGEEQTTDAIEWTFAGASENAYRATIDGNSVTIGCYGGSKTPLTVTASANGESISATIALKGI